MPKLVITMDGGIIHAISSDDPSFFANVEVFVQDYDTEGADEEDLSQVIQADGSADEAVVFGLSIDELETSAVEYGGPHVAQTENAAIIRT